jgi:hypothetical protein
LRGKIFVGMTDYFHAHRLEKMRGQVKITPYRTGHPNERLKPPGIFRKTFLWFSFVLTCFHL